MADLQSQSMRAAEASVFKLASCVSQLKRLVEQLGTPRDTTTLRHKLAESNNSTQQLAKAVKVQLTSLMDSVAVASSPSAPGVPPSSTSGASATPAAVHLLEQDLQDSKAAKAAQLKSKKLLQDFASILTDYKLTQKLAAEREASCLPRQPPAASPGTRSAAAAAAATDLEAQAPSQAGGEEGYERRALLQATQQRDSSRLDGAIAYNEALIEERDVGIADIQRQIAEVNEMFQDLAVLINDQGHQVVSVDEHITTTAERVKEGQAELVKAQRSQRSGQSKCLWLWLIAALVVSILLIVLLT
ncbi:MAG: hypothetical protein WDW38_002126 [Sanguina aurantia]